MRRFDLFALLVSTVTLTACGNASSFFGGAAVDTIPRAHTPVDPKEVASDPCRYGDIERCAERCANQHDAPSCNTVGVMLEFGAEGSDYARAATYYRSACGENYAQGCNNLAWLYMVGHGVPRDPPLSIALFTRAYDGYRLACSQGAVEGCVAAAVMLREGRGVDADEDAALAMLTDACQRGDARGCQEMQRLPI